MQNLQHQKAKLKQNQYSPPPPQLNRQQVIGAHMRPIGGPDLADNMFSSLAYGTGSQAHNLSNT